MTIDIINSNGTIKSVFVKANAFLLEKYFEDFQKVDDAHKITLLENLWLTEYKATLLKKHDQWSCISFIRKIDHTMFLLRWS
jgi:hypothetical protein